MWRCQSFVVSLLLFFVPQEFLKVVTQLSSWVSSDLCIYMTKLIPVIVFLVHHHCQVSFICFITIESPQCHPFWLVQVRYRLVVHLLPVWFYQLLACVVTIHVSSFSTSAIMSCLGISLGGTAKFHPSVSTRCSLSSGLHLLGSMTQREWASWFLVMVKWHKI